MSVNFIEKTNLLSGHYQDIIISENETDKYRIKTTPNELYHVKKLDKAYFYPTYNKLSDLEKLEQVIDSYLYHNTIFMISNGGRLKYYSGYYVAINAFPTFINGYQSISRAMYIKLKSQKLNIIMHKILKKYQEDRIRHFNEILNCKEIIISPSLTITSYFIKKDRAYIDLLSRQDNEPKLHLLSSEVNFLKILLIEFIKKNGYHISYQCEQAILYNEDYTNKIVIEDCLIPYALQAANAVYHMNQEQYHNITIEEYLSLINQEQEEIRKKKTFI